MKKNYLYLILLLLSNLLVIGQTVTLTPTSVNGVSVSAGPINLGSTAFSKITLAAEVTLSAPKSNTDPGNIKIYFQKNSTSPSNDTDGGNGGSLLFNGGTSATRSFNITLNLSDFDLTGGYIYAEYETYTKIKYKSTPISIIKSSSNNGGNPPVDNASHPRQTVPYGGIPLMPTLEKSSIDYSQSWQEIIPLSYITDRNGKITTIPEHNIDITNPEIETYNNKKYTIKYLLNGQNAYADNNLMEISVKEFFPTVNGRNYYYLNNQINQTQYIPYGGNPTTITGNQAYEEHGGGRTGTTTVKTIYNNYQWQSRIINYSPFTMSNFNYQNTIYGWKDIPNATLENYTPQTAPYGIEYRRLVIQNPSAPIYNRIFAASNVIGIYPVKENNIAGTSICCDQTYNNSILNPIMGEHMYPNPDFGKYQWQISTDGNSWSNIYNANSRDYQPLVQDLEDRNGRITTLSSRFFRRIFIDDIDNQYTIYYISNVVKVTVNKTNKKTFEKDKVKNEDIKNSIIIYPTPSTSILNIEGLDNISSFNLKIIDLTGKTVLSKEPNQSDNKSLQLDISMLTKGTYLLELENESNKFTKKIIKN